MTTAVTNAINSATDGQTVQLPEPTGEPIDLGNIVVDKSITIDLNGNTINQG